MDKETLARLILFVPEDATEISIKGHETRDVIFSSDHNCESFAVPAQRGTYTGNKKRWRISEETVFRPKLNAKGQVLKPAIVKPVREEVRVAGTPAIPEEQNIDLSSIPQADS